MRELLLRDGELVAPNSEAVANLALLWNVHVSLQILTLVMHDTASCTFLLTGRASWAPRESFAKIERVVTQPLTMVETLASKVGVGRTQVVNIIVR